MIRLRRVALPQETATRLEEYTEEIAGQATEEARKAKADALWSSRRGVRPALLDALTEMAPGHERCMYCGDSQGTDIDHFDPKSRTPLRTFDWFNHLLACSYCNSNQKRSLFPTDGDGSPLLVDPTLRDPLDHLRLVLPLGRYRARTPQGQACIDVFGLNSRPVLVKGRVDAYATARHSWSCGASPRTRGSSTRPGRSSRSPGTVRSSTCSSRCSTSPSIRRPGRSSRVRRTFWRSCAIRNSGGLPGTVVKPSATRRKSA